MQNEMAQTCALTGTTAAPSQLLRFVVSPTGVVVFDREQDLSGDGIWIIPDRKLLHAASQSLFQHAQWPKDLADRVSRRLQEYMVGTLSLLRRSGSLVPGFEKVRQSIQQGKASALVQASDGAEDGRAKLANLAAHHRIPVIACLPRLALAQVTGHANQTHIAILKSGLATKFIKESQLLINFEYGDWEVNQKIGSE